MVHGLVHEHGGHVVVESCPDRGSRFRVIWPVLTDHGAAAPREPAGVVMNHAPRKALMGSVLVVDDDESVGGFMRELLESWGLEAVYLPRPELALDLVRAEPRRFDALITDQSMPKMTGLELAQRLQRIRSDLPIILYSGHGEGLADAEAAAVELCAVMRKPVDPAELGIVLARCLPPGPGG
jgi:CheY-like chemotaxis protein